MYSINFSAIEKRFPLSLHYNGNNSYLFVNGKEIIKSKAKNSEIVKDSERLYLFKKHFKRRI